MHNPKVKFFLIENTQIGSILDQDKAPISSW